MWQVQEMSLYSIWQYNSHNFLTQFQPQDPQKTYHRSILKYTYSQYLLQTGGLRHSSHIKSETQNSCISIGIQDRPKQSQLSDDLAQAPCYLICSKWGSTKRS